MLKTKFFKKLYNADWKRLDNQDYKWSHDYIS